MRWRPRDFRLNPHSPLVDGLVFGGFGQHPGTNRYYDSCAGLVHSGHHGTLTNSVPATDWIPTGRRTVLGNFLKVGADGFVDFGAPLTFSGADHTSATSFWWYRDASGDAVLFGDSSTQFNLWLFYDGTGLTRHYIAIDEVGGNEQAFVDYDITLNTWHHEVLNRYDATNIEVYVDGVSRGTATNANWAGVPSHIETIGANTTAAFGLDGKMADVAFWSRALSTTEISALADPSNADLRVGRVPLILPMRRRAYSYKAGAAAGNRRRRFLIGAA